MSINLQPLHDRVVIKRMEEERLSAGGIVILRTGGAPATP